MVPGARDGHSACVLRKSMYIFGGYEQLVGGLQYDAPVSLCGEIYVEGGLGSPTFY